ncbi:MAG TPA: MFS transporter [Gaiellaceae bacterium]
MRQLGGKLGALQEGQFRLLWLGRVSSSIGDSLIGVALAFAVLEVSGSATALGLVLALFTLSRVALTLVGGVFADRLPRREVMLVCDGARAIVEAFTAAMLLTGQMTLTMFCVTISIFGAASAFFGPASTGLVPQTVSPERLQEANALLGLSQSMTNVFGPVLSGLLVAGVGTGWVFAVDAASFVASALFLLRLKLPAHQRPPAPHFLTDLAKGLQEVRIRPWVWTSMIAFSITNLCFAAFLVLGPVVARNELGGARHWGVIAGGGAIGAVLGGVWALRVRPGRPLFAGFTAWALLALPLLALAPPLPALVVAVSYAVGLGGISFGKALWETTLQARIPREVLSRVSSYDWLTSFVFMPIGFVAFGPMAKQIGIGATLLIAGAAVATVNLAVALLPPVRAITGEVAERRSVRRPAEPRAAA